MAYKDIVSESRRLEILRILKEDPGYQTNQGIIQSALAAVGLDSSADMVQTEIAWLDEQGLVDMSEIGSIRLAKITQRGLDCAKGLSRVPGVARPNPGDR